MVKLGIINHLISSSITAPDQRDLTSSKSQRMIPTLKPINDCTWGTTYISSSCDNGNSGQASTSECSSIWGNIFLVRGNCSKDERCVDGRIGDGKFWWPEDRAYCVNNKDFVYIAINQLEQAGLFQLPTLSKIARTIDKASYSVVAILMDLNGRMLVNASNITAKKQKTDIINDKHLTQPLPGGISTCSDYSKISIPSATQGTQSVLFKVVLPFNVAKAQLLVITSRREIGNILNISVL